MMGTLSDFKMSYEQQVFIEKAIEGKNILVDACIGSGKTTAIQKLCNELPSSKKILYLTYNKLLKIDAKVKIKKRNVTVTNYHGFAYMLLRRQGIEVGISDLIQEFIRRKPYVGKYDVLIIDEYQDIEQELAELLQLVKTSNPGMQMIAVGDMEQKIYDKTTLRVEEFIEEFLGDYQRLRFTQCFRLSDGLASVLGRIWKKEIKGVNTDCKVEEMCKEDIVAFLAKQDPADILCLGARTGAMSDTLNYLEETYPDKFNKRTVYATISDNDSIGKSTPREDSAIFTTYDSSKGLERKICVVFDFTESYWQIRMSKPQQSYAILRNIFCVAASRGKNHIIFVKSEDALLSEKTLSSFVETNQKFSDVEISEMFDFKFKEDIEKCFAELRLSKYDLEEKSLINIKSADELIDLSPCIGIYQEASFFNNYEIEAAIGLKILLKPQFKDLYTDEIKNSSLDEKVLFLVSLETEQKRYRTQVEIPFVNEDQKKMVKARLSTRLNQDENAQVACKIDFRDPVTGRIKFTARGFADVVKEDVVYELKFVSELTHEHFLQCACYMVALNLERGILWNTRDNTMYEIEIPSKKDFLNVVTRTITKGLMEKYYEPKEAFERKRNKKKENFVVIDIETNWDNEMMSIGAVVADSENKKIIDEKYYIITPEFRIGGMYESKLEFYGEYNNIIDRKSALEEIRHWLGTYNVEKIFSYNASFDMSHLPEYSEFEWYDIMRLAAYKQYNRMIPDTAECCKSGRLKRGYSAENILNLLRGEKNYIETHNALFDAEDELEIMRLLDIDICEYDVALLSNKLKKKDVVLEIQQNKEYSLEKQRVTTKKKLGIFSRIFKRHR